VAALLALVALVAVDGLVNLLSSGVMDKRASILFENVV
jgi:ABC-type lipoprotein release transport system permease subunit